MALFPSLVPASRSYTPGNLPQVQRAALSGVATTFRRGNRRTNQTLSLSFENLTEAEVTEIRTHYEGQKGSYEIFYLSSEVWNGWVGTAPVPLISDYAWRYLGAPTIADGYPNQWSVEVELETIPIELGELIFSAEAASATPGRTYILDGLGASDSPAREHTINGGASG